MNTQAGGASDRPHISSDGNFVVYVSLAANLILTDSNAVADIFIYDRNAVDDGATCVAAPSPIPTGGCGAMGMITLMTCFAYLSALRWVRMRRNTRDWR